LKRLPLAVLTTCALGASVHAVEPWPPEGSRLVDRVVAIVNKEPVTLFELQRAVAPQLAPIMRAATEPAERERLMKRAIDDALDGLIDDILVYAEAQEMELSVAPEKIDAHLAKIRDDNGWTDDELASQLQKLGFSSVADYRRHTEREMLKSQVVGIKVASRVKVDEAEVEVELKRQLGKSNAIEERRASHILIRLPDGASREAEERARATLLEAKAQIESGAASFGDMARRMSEDGTRNAGGDLGWFAPGDYHPDFEAVAFKATEGEVAGPFRTPFGMHLVVVTETRRKTIDDAGDTEALKRQIRYNLRERSLEKVYRTWVRSLRTEAFVEVKDLGLGG
jgi:parvulin-like peptidyl-prolyl isomerase